MPPAAACDEEAPVASARLNVRKLTTLALTRTGRAWFVAPNQGDVFVPVKRTGRAWFVYRGKKWHVYNQAGDAIAAAIVDSVW